MQLVGYIANSGIDIEPLKMFAVASNTIESKKKIQAK